MARPPRVTCAVPKCDRPPRHELEDEAGRVAHVCGQHVDTWTAHWWGKYRTVCTQRPYHHPPPKPEQAQPTLF
jgi:hypothetical protein